jgi:hypothetical protein
MLLYLKSLRKEGQLVDLKEAKIFKHLSITKDKNLKRLEINKAKIPMIK